MDFQSLNVLPLKQLVVNELEGKILSGKIPSGSKLPSEAELSKTLGVGRRTIREALHILQARGLVEIRQGKGAFVIRNDFDTYLTALSGNISSYLKTNKGKIEHVLEIREIFEIHALKAIIDNRNTLVLSRLRDNIQVQKQAFATQDSALYHRTHLDFHTLLIQSLDNPIILMVYEQIMKLIEDIVQFYAHVPEQMERSIQEHEDIVASLEAADLSQSVQKMITHLSRAYENFKRKKSEEEGA
ncbi:MAG: GntR family transcriptional regulator [Spirochaetes bacterium]|nr:GntR family transcriptional regulator [Spirochaetota bacterium]